MGQPSARIGDTATHVRGSGAVLMGCNTVIIDHKAAARKTDLVQHDNSTEQIMEGESSVLINGLPAARYGDRVGCGGAIAIGCTTVLIGRSHVEACLAAAAAEGMPLVEQMP